MGVNRFLANFVAALLAFNISRTKFIKSFKLYTLVVSYIKITENKI